ncbi:MAG: hypothetical protein KZQ63_16170 [Candidatus Thiodiazotropha sp. (ex Lucinoma aequizonata)]|nr:hypothetical protein [Candidatus Thiodiazotropha sp. (ex Lucinoma aequizonata)]MCU7898414.1 hypothetical protein [Candidatus Thiodiazotropha sp. (ex Lucinoma aequizonata)]MCU7913381.1 hypothetical protein [Candidatus Thiodiazotropha sp. (ex Lucinoma aequizonata)]
MKPTHSIRGRAIIFIPKKRKKQIYGAIIIPLGEVKRVFDLVKDFGTSQSTKIDSIFDSLLCPERPAYVTIPYCTSTASCSCTTPS